MKSTLSTLVLVLAAGTAAAQPFDFQRQFGSTEYVYDADTRHMTFAPVQPSGIVPSLHAVMLAADVDGIAPYHHVGDIVPSGPTRISLYEVQRGSPEAAAYADYYARYPADTDWDRLAREFRAGSTDGGIASEAGTSDDRS